MRPFPAPRLLLCSVLLLASTPRAQDEPYTFELSADTVSLTAPDEDGIPVEQLIRLAERITGKSFTFSQQEVEDGGIHFTGTMRVERDRFFDFFQTMLYVHGYACVSRAVGDTEVVEVVRMEGPIWPARTGQTVAVEPPIYVPPESLGGYEDRAGTEVLTAIPLEHLDVHQVAPALRPFSRGVTLGNVGDSRSILLQGSPSRVYLASRLIDLIDVPPPQDAVMRSFQPQHTSAGEIVGLLRELFTDRRPDIEVARSGEDTVIVRGDRNTVAEVLELMSLLDR